MARVTEFHGVFLMWIVLRELYRGAALFFCFKFQVQSLWLMVLSCRTKSREVLHRVARSFFEVVCVERGT